MSIENIKAFNAFYGYKSERKQALVNLSKALSYIPLVNMIAWAILSAIILPKASPEQRKTAG